MKNNNSAAIRRLSVRSMKNNRMRNLFAVCAIALTAMLFTATFSLLCGMVQASQENTMREVGTRAHAGLKEADMQQYEKVSKDPLVKKSSYDILLGFAENIQKRQAEIRFMPFEDALGDYFITLSQGRLPETEDEIVVDTYILDELKLPYALGEKVPLVFSFMGETFEREFVVSGFYEGSAVSHASELFISGPFWQKVRGGRTEDDMRAWGKAHPDEQGRGLLSVHLFFSNASDAEEKVQKVIADAGYEPGTELDYGVNWAYMENRMESVDPMSAAMIAAALAVILLTGYLIIYNIFQISIMGDIRFYGLLKTIGTTKQQLQRLIMRQVLRLLGIGIPIGLLLGYAVGSLGMPVFGRLLYSGGNVEIQLQFHPAIFIFGAAFSAVTVFLSCRKPGKIAGGVSPVEAVKYTEAAIKISGKKRRHRPFHPFTMALANLGRNKKKTGVVVAAMALSMVLLTLVMTGAGSFRISQFLEARIAGDIMIGGADVFQNIGRNSIALDEKFAAYADGLPGIEGTNEMWYCNGRWMKIDEKAKEGLRKLDREGKLSREYGQDPFQQERFGGYFFGYTDGLFQNMKVLEGTVDVEKFQTGDYILLTCFYGTDILGPEDSLYHPGDKVTVQSIGKDSVSQEIKNDAGELVDIVYDNLKEKEYEVMAVVAYPHSMDLGRYTPNGMDAVLPVREFQNPEMPDNVVRFAKSYQVRETDREGFETAVKDYTENIDPLMGYASKQTLEKEFYGLVNAVSLIGVTLSGVIALIGILNFINAVFTGILSRKREFAMLQSIGMTARQLRGVVVCEGISYVIAAGLISLPVGSILAYVVLYALNQVILFFEYRFRILPFLILLPILFAVAAVTPMVAFWRLQKESLVERLREAE